MLRGVALGGRPGALPRPRPLPGPPHHPERLVHYHGVKRGNILGCLAWVAVAVAVSPVVLTFALAYLAPEVLELIVANRTEPQLAPYWALAEWYYGLLGFATADGENPYRVLGVPQTASETQIRKRFRQLSIKYHPDKTGNDPKKKEYFMKLQGAMEVITKGTFDGPANENATRERMRGAVTRCSELTPIIGIWTALAAWAFLKWLTRDRSREMRAARAASEGDGAGEENAELAREIPREYVIGPSFLGGSMLGYGVDRGDRTRERYGDAGPRAEARTVGGRRVATPQVPMPGWTRRRGRTPEPGREQPPRPPPPAWSTAGRRAAIVAETPARSPPIDGTRIAR